MELVKFGRRNLPNGKIPKLPAKMNVQRIGNFLHLDLRMQRQTNYTNLGLDRIGIANLYSARWVLPRESP